MKKKKSKRERNYNKSKKRRERERRETFEKRYYENVYSDCKQARKKNTFAERHGKLGKLLYSYSDARTWIDLPRGQRFKRIFLPQRIFLTGLAAVLCIWFLTALIYQLSTTDNAGKTLLHLLPSFLIIAAGTAILIISVLGEWSKFLKWAFRNKLVRGRDALSRQRLSEMKIELELADRRKAIENRIDITSDYVVLCIYGTEEIYRRELISATATKKNDQLSLTLNIDGFTKDFPPSLPPEEYVPLKKVLGDKLTAVRSLPETEKLSKQLVKEIPALFMVLIILTAGVMLVVAHYEWIPEIPPFLGVFFTLMSLLALCNTISFIPPVKVAGIPLIFSLVLLTVPPWALVWFHQNIFHSEGGILKIILNCDVFTAAFSFFTVLGAYVFTFAVSKIIDYIRFGKQ